MTEQGSHIDIAVLSSLLVDRDWLGAEMLFEVLDKESIPLVSLQESPPEIQEVYDTFQRGGILDFSEDSLTLTPLGYSLRDFFNQLLPPNEF